MSCHQYLQCNAIRGELCTSEDLRATINTTQHDENTTNMVHVISSNLPITIIIPTGCNFFSLIVSTARASHEMEYLLQYTFAWYAYEKENEYTPYYEYC